MLLASRVTEKSTLAGALNKYVFTVARTSTKKEVAKAIERKYGVHVSAVNIINAPSKKVRLGRTIGHVPGFKKAVVTLEDGQRIEVGV
ncbi:MAG: 50S ribosomal protein L23 [Candidatus Sungbacteria bacterium RIFCSPLOWO2_02_FULL_51_17]|uniref:50S ribosomal protein L23 n=1 Tax=Candidatus Sungbacteria bacterium RIFCSPHIGHO2_02_FULL_51_29 TaxID=1802273 RepID=A0A1G2KSR2_9BACT|nr:MAG: 50S ribosomal protein L23 [Candidatus Sungbacteria bacterium RIFCSPHIGHO2_01_FULL_51_22]OHA02498.1 MAG: 50S ribosomal protein L23 [Candidatus Sungbacteria bacterium RIFCSPHIGHO2_02_FULL_51_29]OHA07956.1 MAG: 50S ribosomal protein L23 [Candidatus Sungbacteria bacterium RIFCSPLOWO2_01_FULL_51_34]OHA11964.1 MAG: 50S ribosomal protein L23 [Candidatus Sungbacteria bacterium RIFCSPLOWO2_02_FULL_51_17]